MGGSVGALEQVVVGVPHGPGQRREREHEGDPERLRQTGPAVLDRRGGLAQVRVEGHARLGQQAQRRHAPGHDEDLVVGQGLDAATLGPLDLELDQLRMDGGHPAAVEHVEATLVDAGLQPPGVARAQAEEGLAPVGQGDPVARLLRQTHGGLGGAVASAHHEDAPALVGVGVEQAVGDLGQVLPRDPEFRGRAAPPDRQAHVARHRLPRRGAHDPQSVLVAPRPLEDLAAADREGVLGGDAPPQADQLLLRVRVATQATVEGKVDGLREHELAARVLGHRPAHALGLVDRDEAQAQALRLEGAGQAGGTRAHDDQVERAVVGRRLLAQPSGHLRGHGGSVADGGLDQRVSRDLPRQEEPRRAHRLELLREDRNVAALLQVRERDRDGAHRALALTGRRAHAARAVHDLRLAVDQLEHALLGAGRHAGPAAETARQVDDRVLQLRLGAALPHGHLAILDLRAHARELRPPGHGGEEREGQREEDPQQQGPAHRVPSARCRAARTRAPGRRSAWAVRRVALVARTDMEPTGGQSTSGSSSVCSARTDSSEPPAGPSNTLGRSSTCPRSAVVCT